MSFDGRPDTLCVCSLTRADHPHEGCDVFARAKAPNRRVVQRCIVCGNPIAGRPSRLPDGEPAHQACGGRRLDQVRKPRTGPRPRSIPQARAQRAPTRALLRELLAANQALLSEPGVAEDFLERPRTWGECRDRTGPCPYVGCKYHLYLDINPKNGTIKINYPDLEPDELQHPCVLRLGPLTLEQTGERMNLTRERVRQIEIGALIKLSGIKGLK